MRVVRVISITDFEPWGGAEQFYQRLNNREFDLLDDYFDECFDYINETALNDILWFDDEYLITEILEEDYEEFYNREPIR